MVNEDADPEWSRPWSGDIDHIISISAQFTSISITLFTLFCGCTPSASKRGGLHCGATTSALNQIRPNDFYLHPNGRDHNAQLQQIHQILLAEQHRHFPVCLHAHFWAIEDTRGSGGVTTFTNPYGTFREMTSPGAFRAH